MKILFVAHTYPRWSGDRAGAQVYRFAKEAVARGHTVRVIAPHAAGAKEGWETLDGVEVYRFRYASDARERIGYKGAVGESVRLGALVVFPSYLLRFRAAVRRVSAEFAPDVLSVHWWLPGALATWGAPGPVAVTCHGTDVRLLGASALIRTLGRTVLRGVRGLSGVSQLMVDDLTRWIERSDVQLTPMPIDDSRFAPGAARAEPPVVLFAGNLIPTKGVDLILRATATLKQEGIPFRLRLVGDGPGRGELGQLAEALGIGDVTDWAGPKGHDQMPGEFASASVFVLASRGPRGEGMPLTVVEALLSGCTVVATPAGGVPELVEDGESGLLVRDQDAAHLAVQLGRVLRDQELRSRLAAEGRRRVLARHGQRQAMDRFFDFLGGVAKGGR